MLSRLIIKVGLPEQIVGYVICRKKISLGGIAFYLVAVSAFLSLFIPNVITVLTLIPVLELLLEKFRKNGWSHPGLPSLFVLSVVYGANIGGMGTITGTPANGILLTFLVSNSVPGTELIQYTTWLMWGIPLVLVMTILAWIVISIILKPWKMQRSLHTIQFSPSTFEQKKRRRVAVILAVFYFISSNILSTLMLTYPQKVIPILIITLVFTIFFGLFLFFYPINDNGPGMRRAPLLAVPDCYSNLPSRGFLFVGVAVALATILYLLKLHVWVSSRAAAALPTDVHFFTFLLLIALATSFSTELLSNTAVQNQFVRAYPSSLPDIGISNDQGLDGGDAFLYVRIHESNCHRS